MTPGETFGLVRRLSFVACGSSESRAGDGPACEKERMKRTSKRALFALAAIACLPLACKDGGCGGSNGASPSASASLAPPPSAPFASTSANRPRPAIVRASGATGALFRAVSTLEIRPEQKAGLDKIAADMRDAEKAASEGDAGTGRSEMKASHDDLVAGVKSGKIDAAKMDAHLALMEKASKARQDREADALGKLHALLDPAQRAATVAAVKAMEEKREARMRARMADAGAAHDGGADGGVRVFNARTRLENMTKDLALEPDQAKKVQAMLPKDEPKTDLREEAKKRSDATLEAFQKDELDAKSLEIDPKKATQPMAETVKFLTQLVPILTPIQRDKLVVKVERGPMAEGRRPFPRGGDEEEEQLE